MKIALIGYGKMGKIIEKIALSRGHEIVARIDVDNMEDIHSDAFRSADAAIEFTMPKVAEENCRKALEEGVPVVCGTTGWADKMDGIKKLAEEKGKAFFWTSNFSVGVNVFFAVNKYLAKIMNGFDQYDVSMTETHHIHKLDAPSGTAVTLAEGILENLERKKYVTAKRYGNTYQYTPLVKEYEYKKIFLNRVVDNYFSNSYKEMVSFFAKEQKISAKELKEIIDMIEKGQEHKIH